MLPCLKNNICIVFLSLILGSQLGGSAQQEDKTPVRSYNSKFLCCALPMI